MMRKRMMKILIRSIQMSMMMSKKRKRRPQLKSPNQSQSPKRRRYLHQGSV
jgi:hypothetical protein